jgi:hypothetical protein
MIDFTVHEEKMTNKKFWLGTLIVALVFGMTVIGCNDTTNEEESLPMGSQWTMVSNPPFGTGSIYDIAFGENKFIAVGYFSDGDDSVSKIAYSEDGINWSLVSNLPSDIHPTVIVYGDGKWVTNDSYSTNGLNWTEATNKLSINSPKIAYGNKKFVAVGGKNQIAHSTDGQTWETVSNPPSFITDDRPDLIFGITYGNGKFIAVGGNKIANSTDGINWTTVSPDLFGNYIHRIAYGGGKFVASSSYVMAYSLNGIDWMEIIGKEKGSGYSNFHYYKNFNCIAYGNGKWIALISSGWIAYSSDGINWTPAFNPPDITFPSGATYGNGKFVVIGSNYDNSNNSRIGRIAYSIQ